MKRLLLRKLLALALLFVVGCGRERIHVFKGVEGPLAVSTLPKPEPAQWRTYAKGSASRLAVLLTDPASSWLGLAHGLKSIGVPFQITDDFSEAVRHRVVLVYPTISGKLLSKEALKSLAEFCRNGGTLIGFEVLGGGLNEVFGFTEAVPSRTHFEVRFGASAAEFGFHDAREKTVSLGNRMRFAEAMGTYACLGVKDPPLARYEDGQAAITSRRVGKGRALAFGIDLGALLLKGYNNREEWIARSYVNDYEPTLDVFLRLIRQLYDEGEPLAVTLGTVPDGRRLAVIFTHDIDYAHSVENAVQYAEFEKSHGIRATYFLQTKYVRDYNDAAFFNEQALPFIQRIESLGMELASHTVCHSRVFRSFPLGTGQERYPSYAPFVKDRLRTRNGTIFGEVRVSKFLIEYFTPAKVVSFRPGVLSNPYALPEVLQATGYRFSSSVTANNSLTHLPFQLNHGRESTAEVPIFEIPITIEDEELPEMGSRVEAALELARKIRGNGGLFVILIHPNILGHKLEFERKFFERVKSDAWFGSIADFGTWWSARNQVQADAQSDGLTKRVRLHLPVATSGLVLRVPDGWKWRPESSPSIKGRQDGRMLVLSQAQGNLDLVFR